ncbi:MAG: hypothetical protein WA395_10755 [Nitrososphaeraceae archaeon]|jgi:hypothetical protein
MSERAEPVALVPPHESSEEIAAEYSFRGRYAKELEKKRVPGVNNYFGPDELLEERVKVNQQQMKTPGRRGEIIKQEEIAKEIIRRISVPIRSTVIGKVEKYTPTNI